MNAKRKVEYPYLEKDLLGMSMWGFAIFLTVFLTLLPHLLFAARLVLFLPTASICLLPHIHRVFAACVKLSSGFLFWSSSTFF